MKKKPYTPNSIIRNALRQVWMRSRERSKALKDHGMCCARCGIKQTAAKGREVKLEVHHKNMITNWDRIFKVIREELLTPPENLEPMCKPCHLEEHEDDEPQKRFKQAGEKSRQS